MNTKNQTRFIHSVAVILFVTAASQIFTAMQIPPLLNHEPLLQIPLSQIFYLIGGLELALSAYLLAGGNAKLKLSLITWLILNLFVYQTGLYWNGSPNFLNCFGNLNASFPVPPRVLSWIMLLLFSYGFLGSCVFLIWDCLHDRRAAGENRNAIGPKKVEPVQTA